MEISKRGFITLAACAVAVSLFAGTHHHRHGRPLPPNAYWCHKCDGDGYNWTWYGWKKTCGICDGRGWCVKKLPVVVPPPPPRVAPPPPPPPKRVAPPPPPPPHKKPHHNPPPPPPAKGHKGGPRR